MREEMTQPRTPRPAGGAPRIAVLEDDPSQAKLVQTWIVSQGFVCRLFERGHQAIRVFAGRGCGGGHGLNFLSYPKN